MRVKLIGIIWKRFVCVFSRRLCQRCPIIGVKILVSAINQNVTFDSYQFTEINYMKIVKYIAFEESTTNNSFICK